jgi:C-terminal processing protease CtpA/Prc
VAVLHLNDFDQPRSAYSTFLANAFRRIREAHATSLIIDLRNNNGGDSREADEMQAYLSDRNLPSLRASK